MTDTDAKITAPRLKEHLRAQRVPRYTSYPPATEFDTLSEGTQKRWLSELNTEKPVSLYIHIPYCDQLCWFCGCFTTITHRYEPVKSYLDLLLNEIDWIHGITGKLEISHLHLGGGSPTALNAGDFSTLLDRIHDRFSFVSNAELAVEIDPRTIDLEKIKAYAASGITRASLGVQDFSQPVQEAVNRIQPYSLVKEVTDNLRQAGISRINHDLMYGLPLQTVESVTETARRALTLKPDRLAVFGYAHVPWMRKHQCVLDKFPMADPGERLKMFHAVKKVFTNNGYESIGIDHFAARGDDLTESLHNRTMRRNFQGYTTDQSETLIGLGLSSISSLPQGYIQNTLKMQDYKRALQEKASIARRGVSIENQDQMRRTLISELMCFYDADLKQIAEKYDTDEDFSDELKKLEPLFKAGMIRQDDAVLQVTESGRPYVRNICAAFDQYIKDDAAHFSLAV